MKEIKDMTSAEMIEEYNAATGKSITKFSSRTKGEQQLGKIRAQKAKEQQKEQQADETVNIEPKKINLNRSKATSNTWNNKEIAEMRATRNGVVVNGNMPYKSVAQAFKQLGLDLKKHIFFRVALKKAGELDYVEQGKTFKFKIA